MIKLVEIWLKEVTVAELKPMWEISYGPEADLKWKEFAGPYFEDPILS